MRDTYARARGRAAGPEIAVAMTRWHVPKRTLRGPLRSRVKLAGTVRAYGEANRAVATGQARFPVDEYVKEQEEPRGDGV